jgi:hypothetical protein
MREHDAFRGPGRARCVEEHRGLARTRHDGVERAGVEETIEAVGSVVAEMHRWDIRRAVRTPRPIAEHELRAGIAEDEMDGLAGEFEVHRNRDQAGAHDAVVGGEKFRAIGGENADAIPARKAAPGQRPCDAVRHVVDLAIGKITGNLLAAEIDDCNLA